MSGTAGGRVGSVIETPTRAEIAEEIEIIAAQMRNCGHRMAYVGGFGELGDHGREMIEAANTAQGWVDHLRTTERGRG